MGREEMNQPLVDETMFMALATSLCDVIVTQIIETRAIIQVLERKGLLSGDEWQRAKKDVPPETVQQISDGVQTEVRRRMAERYQRMKIPRTGPIQ
jgi:hypothetical protein